MATPPRFLSIRTISIAVAVPSPLDAGECSAGSRRRLRYLPPSVQNSRLPTIPGPTTDSAAAETPRTLDSPTHSSKSPPLSQSSSAAENPEKYVHDPPPLLTYQSQSQTPGQSRGIIPLPVRAVAHAALLSDTWVPTLNDTLSR